jgi:hypothetical protein
MVSVMVSKPFYFTMCSWRFTNAPSHFRRLWIIICFYCVEHICLWYGLKMDWISWSVTLSLNNIHTMHRVYYNLSTDQLRAHTFLYDFHFTTLLHILVILVPHHQGGNVSATATKWCHNRAFNCDLSVKAVILSDDCKLISLKHIRV